MLLRLGAVRVVLCSNDTIEKNINYPTKIKISPDENIDESHEVRIDFHGWPSTVDKKIMNLTTH